MKEIELRALDIDLSPDEDFDEDEGLRLHGYVATDASSHILGKEGKKKWREIITPGTFQKAIAKARRIKESIDFLVDHDTKKILASTVNDSLTLEEDEVGLYFDAKISKTSWGKDLYVLVKDGIIKGLSFGMKVLDESWSLSSDGMPLRTIHEIELYEISALKTPAYPTTLLEARGLHVADIEVPEKVEEKSSELRSLIGGNGMNNEQEVTPKMVYDAISTLAMNQAETNKLLQEIVDKSAFEGLEMAKQVMEQVQQVASAQVPPLPADQMTPPAEDPAKAGQEVKEEVTTEEKPVDEKPAEDVPADGEEVRAEDKPAEEKPTEEKAPEVGEETKPTEEKAPEAKPADEKPAEKPTDAEAQPTEEKPAEGQEAKPADEDEEKKKQVTVTKEIRAWLENHKIVEVPENGD